MNFRFFSKVLLPLVLLGTVQPALSQLSNPGFEIVESIGGWSTDYANWNLDPASVVGPEQGVTPRSGVGMLRFLGTDASEPGGFGIGTDGAVSQLFDLRSFAGAIAIGALRLDLSGYFNRIVGTASTDTQFGVYIRTYSGSPVNFQANVGSPLAAVNSTLFSDSNPVTWQESSISLLVPQGSTYAEIGLLAVENVNSSDSPPFHGHYADDVVLIASVPEASTVQMLLLGSTFLLLLRRRAK